jgi:hypothetical protein
MLSFSKDAELLKFEPGVFGAWFLASQVLCGGTNGIVSGTQFTAGGVDFVASGVQAGGVIWLQSADGAIEGAFEIVEVIDAGHLTVSVVRSSAEQAAAIPVGAASGLTWRIVSYAPQGYEMLWQISQRLGLAPGAAGAAQSVDDIVNPDALRQASVFGVLGMIFTALYEGLDGQAVLNEKAEQYQWRFDEAMQRVRVQVDTDGDNDADRTIRPGVVCLVRK